MTQGSAKGSLANWTGSTSLSTVGTITTGTWLGSSLSKLAEGRLTLTSNTPVTTSDVTGATTLYYTPFRGNRIAIYNGSVWKDSIFTQLSIAVPATTSQMYDVWIYLNAGVPTLELSTWTNDTTRTTSLTTQDGIYVKSGDATRRYLGSFRTTTVSGQTEDSVTFRYLWNYYNRVRRVMKAVDTTNSWTYSTASFRQARATSTNQLDLVVGVDEEPVYVMVQGKALNSTSTARAITVGVGLDGANTVSVFDIAITVGCISNDSGYPQTFYDKVLTPGRHTLAWLERGGGADTQTWYGDEGTTYEQTGIFGYLFG